MPEYKRLKKNVPLVVEANAKPFKPRELKLMPGVATLSRSAEQWKALLSNIPANIRDQLKSSFWEAEEELMLSALNPVVEGRGHISAGDVYSYTPTVPSLFFANGHDNRWHPYPPVVSIWLDGLDPQGIYFVEIRCSLQGGALRVRASHADNAEYGADDFGESIDIVLVNPTSLIPWSTGPTMSLIELEPRSDGDQFTFYYARVWRAT